MITIVTQPSIDIFMIKQVIRIVKQASQEIMKIYISGDLNILDKADNSPITKADLLSNKIIIEGLKKISNYPIVTEETSVAYKIRRNWNTFWLVDPLDGTKDFIVKNDEFTINIALIERNQPILGVVCIPASGEIYSALRGKGAYKNGIKIYNTSSRKELIGADSNFYSTPDMKDFFKKYHIQDIRKIGSAIKICKLAEGIIDVYPRLNETKEWDTAAVHIIANEAGCKLIDIETKKELIYNKKSIKNNFFIASRNDLEFEV